MRLGRGLRLLFAGCVFRVATCQVITTTSKMTPIRPTTNPQLIFSIEKELDDELGVLVLALELLFGLDSGAGLTAGKLSIDNWGVVIS